MTKLAAASLLAFTVLLSPAVARADSAACAKVLGMLNPDAGQSLFYRDANRQWAEVPNEGLALTSRRAYLIYVIREFFPGTPRSGAVVVKTGRMIAADEADPAPLDKRISLRRLRPREADECLSDTSPLFLRGRVSALDYDLYHDFGYDERETADGVTLTRFHTAYTGRNGRCKSTTASTTRDAFFSDRRSNRSQFSFAARIVRDGFDSMIFAGSRFHDAKPIGSVGLTDQRVEILRYRADAQGLACIPIAATLTGRDFFVRVNDLEGRSKGDPFTRAGELARRLTR